MPYHWQAVHQDFSQVRIGKTLVLYRAEEHRVLELLKNLALGRVFQHMQACSPTRHAPRPMPHAPCVSGCNPMHQRWAISSTTPA